MLKPLILLLSLWALPLCGTAEEEAEVAVPNYFELKPSLIANLATGGKYVRCDVQLMTLDEEQLANIELHAPSIRHELLMLMGDQDGVALGTPEGKDGLRRQALEAVQGVLQALTGKPGVDEIFFTAFFVQ
jgi:flagellar FliL protein